MNRIGYHFRQSIVEEAKEALAAQGLSFTLPDINSSGRPEAIPQSQEEINKQADAFLRDLFPRIPRYPHAFPAAVRMHLVQESSPKWVQP